MAVVGHVHKITNQTKFFSAVLMNKKPPETSFGSIGAVQIELLTRFDPGNVSEFELTWKQDVSSPSGAFTFNHPELPPLLEKQAKLQLVVRKLLDPKLPPDWGPEAPIQILDSIYRSAEFTFDQAKGNPVDIFIAFDTTPKDQAVAGAIIDQAVSTIMAAMNADKKLDSRAKPVSGYAFIWSDGVNMHLATGSGAASTVSDFRFCLLSSESPNLSAFFSPVIVDFRSHHSCFVSDEYVRGMLQQGVDNAFGAINGTIHQTLVDELAKETGQSSSLVQSFLDSSISTTFRRVRYPKIGEHTAKPPIGNPVELPDFGIAPDPCFGFPRTLFGK